MNVLILASSSAYRRMLLEKLRIPFSILSPEIDETPKVDESPVETASRLAREKAEKAGIRHPDALIIGCDQVAVLGEEVIGKPCNFDNAFRQLKMMRGKTVTFYSALCLYHSGKGSLQSAVVPCEVSFRNYTDAQIENYLNLDEPYHCAGSAKSEGLGIALIASMKTEDPNALVGLPLIALVDMLKKEGIEVV